MYVQYGGGGLAPNGVYHQAPATAYHPQMNGAVGSGYYPQMQMAPQQMQSPLAQRPVYGQPGGAPAPAYQMTRDPYAPAAHAASPYAASCGSPVDGFSAQLKQQHLQQLQAQHVAAGVPEYAPATYTPVRQAMPEYGPPQGMPALSQPQYGAPASPQRQQGPGFP
ncbi:unnamed protein product, partial [Polarella glacialis]